ncbi:MAG: hypothetical protein MUC59_16465 [Saprospiraceae bacterium]|nr:hypothetical protein [Saprospiraceae bacterium]
MKKQLEIAAEQFYCKVNEQPVLPDAAAEGELFGVAMLCNEPDSMHQRSVELGSQLLGWNAAF